jgi:hypothetical protein
MIHRAMSVLAEIQSKTVPVLVEIVALALVASSPDASSRLPAVDASRPPSPRHPTAFPLASPTGSRARLLTPKNRATAFPGDIGRYARPIAGRAHRVPTTDDRPTDRPTTAPRPTTTPRRTDAATERDAATDRPILPRVVVRRSPRVIPHHSSSMRRDPFPHDRSRPITHGRPHTQHTRSPIHGCISLDRPMLVI